MSKRAQFPRSIVQSDGVLENKRISYRSPNVKDLLSAVRRNRDKAIKIVRNVLFMLSLIELFDHLNDEWSIEQNDSQFAGYQTTSGQIYIGYNDSKLDI